MAWAEWNGGGIILSASTWVDRNALRAFLWTTYSKLAQVWIKTTSGITHSEYGMDTSSLANGTTAWAKDTSEYSLGARRPLGTQLPLYRDRTRYRGNWASSALALSVETSLGSPSDCSEGPNIDEHVPQVRQVLEILRNPMVKSSD